MKRHVRKRTRSYDSRKSVTRRFSRFRRYTPTTALSRRLVRRALLRVAPSSVRHQLRVLRVRRREFNNIAFVRNVTRFYHRPVRTSFSLVFPSISKSVSKSVSKLSCRLRLANADKARRQKFFQSKGKGGSARPPHRRRYERKCK